MDTTRGHFHKHAPKVSDQHGESFNDKIALKITNGVSTMWCAYLFALIALVTLPEAIKGGSITLVPWVAQTFLQLVLLSIIMVGQKVQSRATDAQTAHQAEGVDTILDRLDTNTAGGIKVVLDRLDSVESVLRDPSKPGATVPRSGPLTLEELTPPPASGLQALQCKKPESQ